MRKHVFILTFFIFFLNNFLNAQNSFSAKINFPSVVIQGESVKVILDIFKPQGLRTYTVFSQKLPAGFYVNAVDLKGASMTYKNNELVFTWLRIPEDSKLSVTYEISTMTGITGTFKIAGKLSYMVEGKLGQFDLHSYSVNVKNKGEGKIVSGNTDDHSEIPQYISYNKNIKCSRRVIYNKKKKVYEVEIRLKKKENCSYTIVEKFPKNFKFTEIESLGAEVFVNKSLVQYYWKTLPGSKENVLKYKLEPLEDKNKKPVFFGKLSMLKSGHIYNIPIYTED